MLLGISTSYTITNIYVLEHPQQSQSQYLQCRSIILKTKKFKNQLRDTQDIHTLNTSNDLHLGLNPLVVDHKIDHKYPKPLCIPILNTAYNKDQIPRATVISTLDAVEVESSEVSNISWTTTEQSQNSTK